MAACRSRTEKTPDLKRCFVNSAESPSTLLSREPEAHVNWKNVSMAFEPPSLWYLLACTFPANTRTTSRSVIGNGLDRRILSTEESSPQHFTFKNSAARSGAEVLA